MTLSPPPLYAPPPFAFDLSEVLFALFKRTMDLTFAALMLPFICVMAGVLWMINPLFNPGPVFYGQWRVGLNEVPFHLWKFRTLTHDQQVTRLGRFLRRSHLDELPQCWNLIKGDMVLVGPRPEQVGLYWDYVDQIAGFDRRQNVRPGLTGVSQVKLGRTDDAAGAAQKLRWDMVYLRGLGLRMELAVLWRTIRMVRYKNL